MIINDINDVWVGLVEKILGEGLEVKPRGLLTYEILSNKTVVDMKRSILTIPHRKLNYRFMFGEAWWILSGSNRVSDITQYLKNIGNYSDDGLTFRGAYGPKIIDQLDYVISQLSYDKSSRQAVLNIWKENPRNTKDYPCTLNMQWVIRDKKLHCITNMRSSDVWFGWNYDVFNFSMISLYVLIALKTKYNMDISLGDLHLSAGSQHLYSNHFEDAGCIIEDSPTNVSPIVFNANDFDHPKELVKVLKQLADAHRHSDEYNPNIIRRIAKNGKTG